MATYIVSHYHQNPRHNTVRRFTSLAEAHVEYMKYYSDEPLRGVSYLEISGDATSFKKRKWNQRKGMAFGKFSRKGINNNG